MFVNFIYVVRILVMVFDLWKFLVGFFFVLELLFNLFIFENEVFILLVDFFLINILLLIYEENICY